MHESPIFHNLECEISQSDSEWWWRLSPGSRAAPKPAFSVSTRPAWSGHWIDSARRRGTAVPDHCDLQLVRPSLDVSLVGRSCIPRVVFYYLIKCTLTHFLSLSLVVCMHFLLIPVQVVGLFLLTLRQRHKFVLFSLNGTLNVHLPPLGSKFRTLAANSNTWTLLCRE